MCTKENANKIFEDIDVNKTGKIKSSVFINYIEKIGKENPNYEFYSQINNSLATKSEKIFEKLKKISKKLENYNELEMISDINWYIYL